MNKKKEIVTIGVSSMADTRRRLLAAAKGVPQGSHITFDSHELLLRVLTAKRWHIVEAMAGRGALSIREVARRVERDVKAVHADVHALLKAGVLDRTADGQVIFPFDEIRVAYTLAPARSA